MNRVDKAVALHMEADASGLGSSFILGPICGVGPLMIVLVLLGAGGILLGAACKF